MTQVPPFGCAQSMGLQDDIRARMRLIRQEAGLTQLAFVDRLNAAARELFGQDAKQYRQDTLSKIEKSQAPSFEDVAVWAMVDPKHRGKLWLAWNEAVDSAIAAPRRHGPSVIQEPPGDTFDQPIPRKKPGRRQA